jgi:hypothetical protein
VGQFLSACFESPAKSLSLAEKCSPTYFIYVVGYTDSSYQRNWRHNMESVLLISFWIYSYGSYKYQNVASFKNGPYIKEA